MKKTVKALAFLSLVALTAACNKKDTTVTPANDTTTEQATTTEANDTFTVEIEANDVMQFSQNEIKVQVGELVTLKLVHTGKMAKEVMGHNFVLLNKGVDFNAFAQKAALEKNNEYIPVDTGADVIAFTKMIGGGETATVDFTITEAGTYEFLCTFPGHSALMKGIVIAE